MKRLFTLLLASACVCGFAQESKELAKLKKETNANVTISKSTSNPNFILFGSSNALKLKAAGAKAKSEEFLAENFKAFNLKSINDLVFVEQNTDNYGLESVTYRQQYQGIPVYDGVLKFHFNKKEELTAINGNTISNIKANSTPNISVNDAESIAKNLVAKQELNKSNTPLQAAKSNLLIFPKNLAQGGIVTSYLVYEVEVTNRVDVREFLFIDAHTGELVDQFTGIHPIDRKVYEKNTNAANLKWKEGDVFPGTLTSWQQNEVVTSEHVYNFFKNAFGYVSYDAADHSMTTVNNDPTISCPNARWNGTYAGYCDGTATDDVIAHEWGHAYTEYTSNLIYQYQSGALNESYSDVWGETIDLINNYEDEGEDIGVRTTAACSPGSVRWKMGEKATAFGGAIRDMWNPNCNGDPAKVLDVANYYCGTGDSGGVHSNSGVTNHLYALLVDGGTYNGYTMAGLGFVKAAHLWWKAQTTYLISTSDFSNFADALEASANDLVGINLQGLSTSGTAAGLSGQMLTAADIQTVKNGILATQLRSSPATQCNYIPILQAVPDLCTGATSNPLFKETWENGLGNWTVSNIPSKPSTWEARDWMIKSNLPKGRTGKAIFGIDPINGDCASNLQNGILRLESPQINIPTFTGGKYEMAFNHYVATESTWDGGNIKYSLNGGAWTLVPLVAFTQNGYNKTLDGTSSNDNPLKGQSAFTGTDGGSLSGSWGQSVIDLSKIGVASGSNIKFRFEMGTDGCNGVEGWYLDEIYIYNCATLAVEDTMKKNGIQVFPNPTSGFVTIQNLKDTNLKNVEVYSATGQLIQKFTVNNVKKASLDMSQLVNGTYILKINTETESNSVKVIKK